MPRRGPTAYNRCKQILVEWLRARKVWDPLHLATSFQKWLNDVACGLWLFLSSEGSFYSSLKEKLQGKQAVNLSRWIRETEGGERKPWRFSVVTESMSGPIVGSRVSDKETKSLKCQRQDAWAPARSKETEEEKGTLCLCKPGLRTSW